MFYPGDPFEQRKRALIKKLAGGRGASGGGTRVGRPAGAGFGRGMHFGAFGGVPGQRPLAVPQLLGGLGSPGNSGFGTSQPTFGQPPQAPPQAPQPIAPPPPGPVSNYVAPSTSIRQPTPTYQNYLAPSVQGPAPSYTQFVEPYVAPPQVPTIPPTLLQTLLGNYGQPSMPAGYGTRYY